MFWEGLRGFYGGLERFGGLLGDRFGTCFGMFYAVLEVFEIKQRKIRLRYTSTNL